MEKHRCLIKTIDMEMTYVIKIVYPFLYQDIHCQTTLCDGSFKRPKHNYVKNMSEEIVNFTLICFAKVNRVI